MNPSQLLEQMAIVAESAVEAVFCEPPLVEISEMETREGTTHPAVSVGRRIFLRPVASSALKGRTYWEVSTPGATPLLHTSGTEALAEALGMWARSVCREFMFILEPPA